MAQANPGQQLLQLASQYHHWHNENKAKGPESTRNRRPRVFAHRSWQALV